MANQTPAERRLSRTNLTKFRSAYRARPIVLYTGAGVSMGDKDSALQFPGWWLLIEEALRRGKTANPEAHLAALKRFKDPWKAADFVKDKCGAEKFQRALRTIIQDRRRFPKPKNRPRGNAPSPQAKKQLGGQFLSTNTTLNAVVAFCGGLIGRTKLAKRTTILQFRAAPNPRIRAVLTANYDPFLEAASSSKFKIALLKPVAAYGSGSGALRRTPVFHIHGYIPHPDQQRKRGPKKVPWHKQLILDSKSYRKAWDSTNAFGPTMVPQIHYLRHYVTLFVGFSFNDRAVRGLLQRIHGELSEPEDKAKRSHFAFVRLEEFRNRGSRFYSSIGIRPILFESPEDIEEALAKTYLAGLDQDFPGEAVPLFWYAPRGRKPLDERSSRISKTAYWKVLLECRNTAVPFSVCRFVQD